LPPLLFLTDPERTPQPWEQAGRLPPGAGVVLRGFGRDSERATGERLGKVCRERRLTLLVGADEALAEAIGAAGLHLPERDLGRAPAVRMRRPDWLITGAAHSQAELDRAALAGVDAVLLSPVFASASPSAGAPLGVDRFQAWVKGARVPVYALGGVTATTAPALAASRACGLAGVSGI